MVYGRKSWIAELLLDDTAELSQVSHVKSETLVYGSTAGPWGGIGGSAMTEYTMTMIKLRGGPFIIYADERRMGPVKTEHVLDVLKSFPRIERGWIDTST